MKFNKPRVLIAPLDWGLGHATRCISIIKAFEKKGCEVMIAADGATECLLRQEFPQLRYIKLPGYNVTYSAAKWFFPIKMAMQVPRILSAIKKEHQWLQAAISAHDIQLVVSDNRYGLYSDKVPCIFVTHQLQVKAPYRWIEDQVQQMNFKYISRFTECWVPDAEENDLAGELSHPAMLHPFPVHYIGPLARFKKQMTAVRYKYAFLISGPEPQRTLFEKKILQQVGDLKDEVILIRGRPGDLQSVTLPPHVTVHNHLEGTALEKALNSAEYIVSRAGYTSIMEIATLQKRAILIPTPGQTEQEYLAAYLMEKGLAFSVSQDAFSLAVSLPRAAAFDYQAFQVTTDMLEPVMADFLSRYFKTSQEVSFAAP